MIDSPRTTSRTTSSPSRHRRPGRRWRLAVAAGLVTLVAGCSAGGQGAADRAVASAGSAVDSALGHDRGDRVPKNTAPADARFQRDLDALVAKDGIPGIEAHVRDKDGTVRNYTAGVAKLGTEEPVPVDGRVRIASNTKTFTATVVLQLVGEGKIDLDAPVERYLPGLVHGQGVDGAAITVRQVLQQTSGLPEYATVVAAGGLIPLQHTYLDPRQELDAALTQPAEFAPGTAWKYSNTNYLVAGLIVQRVTGRPIGEEITHRVIDRLDLQHTSWPDIGVQTIPGRHAHSYEGRKPGSTLLDVTDLDPSLGWAAGQLISTPTDLSTFNRALLDGKLLEPAQQKELLTTVPAPDFEPEGDWSYGLGFAQRTLRCGVEAYGHGGDITGFETRNLTTRDGRSAVIATTARPTSLKILGHVNAAVEDAVCDQ